MDNSTNLGVNIPRPIWYKKPMQERTSRFQMNPQYKHPDNMFSYIYPEYIGKAPDIILRTFPRSGSNYLFSLLRQYTGFSIPRTHGCKNSCPHFFYMYEDTGTKPINIIVIRNPLDTIVSAWVMGVSHIYPEDQITDTHPNVGDGVSIFINRYSCWHRNFEMDESTIILDYETIVNEPQKVIEFLANLIGVEVQSTHYTNALKDTEQFGTTKMMSNYLVSSKSRSKLYETAKRQISKIDMSECWEIYNNLMKIKSM